METIPTSGYTIANRIVSSVFYAYEEVMGRNGLNAVLNLAQLSRFIDNHPGNDLQRGLDFAEFSALNQAVEETWGHPGSRMLGLRAGRAIFEACFIDAKEMIRFTSQPDLSQIEKIRCGLPVMARISRELSDQEISIHEQDSGFAYRIQRCPLCWGRSGYDKPICHVLTGWLQAGLKWITGGDEIHVMETECLAMDGKECCFVITK